jgi:hypothetical protein
LIAEVNTPQRRQALWGANLIVLQDLIVPVIPFDPDSSLRIISGGFAVLIMALYPISPAIIVTGDPDPFPGSRNPFPDHFPMARNIFRPWRRGMVPRFRRGIIRHLRWLFRMTVSEELKGHCS